MTDILPYIEGANELLKMTVTFVVTALDMLLGTTELIVGVVSVP